MSKNKNPVFASSNRLKMILMGLLSLLLIPLIAMQFGKEVHWTLFDFMIAGVLLSSIGLLLELVLRKLKTTKSRLIACVALLFVFILIWAELAVGVFGTSFAGT